MVRIIATTINKPAMKEDDMTVALSALVTNFSNLISGSNGLGIMVYRSKRNVFNV